jgi:hypothetical protein
MQCEIPVSSKQKTFFFVSLKNTWCLIYHWSTISIEDNSEFWRRYFTKFTALRFYGVLPEWDRSFPPLSSLFEPCPPSALIHPPNRQPPVPSLGRQGWEIRIKNSHSFPSRWSPLRYRRGGPLSFPSPALHIPPGPAWCLKNQRPHAFPLHFFSFLPSFSSACWMSRGLTPFLAASPEIVQLSWIIVYSGASCFCCIFSHKVA